MAVINSEKKYADTKVVTRYTPKISKYPLISLAITPPLHSKEISFEICDLSTQWYEIILNIVRTKLAKTELTRYNCILNTSLADCY